MKLTGRNIVILCCSLVMICAVTFSVRFIKYVDLPGFKIISKVVLNLLNGLIAWIAIKLAGMKVDIDLKNKHQYWIGATIALALSVVIAVIPALCGFSLIGNHVDFSWFVLFYDMLFYLLIIGLVFGFAKYKTNICGYVGVAFGHGLYDFLNTHVRIIYLIICKPVIKNLLIFERCHLIAPAMQLAGGAI